MIDNDVAVGIVFVPVMVIVERQRTGLRRSEQLDERGIVADVFGMAGTADMVVEADHMISGGHH